jgi:hypothetical protein
MLYLPAVPTTNVPSAMPNSSFSLPATAYTSGVKVSVGVSLMP